MGQIKNIKLHIVTDIKYSSKNQHKVPHMVSLDHQEQQQQQQQLMVSIRKCKH